MINGNFIWVRIDDQRQRSFVTGYPGRPPAFRVTKTSETVCMQDAVSEWPTAARCRVPWRLSRSVIDSVWLVGAEFAQSPRGVRPSPAGAGGRRGCPRGSRLLYFWPARQARRFGGLARSIAERLAGTASAPAQCRPGLGHRAAGCIYPQIAADEERAAVDSADGGRDLRLLTGNTWRLVVQGPGRTAADDLSHQRRARGVRGDPRPVPGVEYLRKPAQALGEMPASLRVEIHGDLAALERLPRPWPG